MILNMIYVLFFIYLIFALFFLFLSFVEEKRIDKELHEAARQLEDSVESLVAELPDKLYLCDPEKNTDCKKTGCYLNGGYCYMTTKEECMADKNKGLVHNSTENME